MTRRRPAKASDPNEQLRRQLQALPKEKLVELALSRMVSDPQGRWDVEHQRQPVAKALRDAFDRAMNVRGVEWKALTGYMGQLNQILNDAEALAKVNPAEGLAVIEHFIAGIPKVFDRVHDECELAEFCDSLTEVGLATARRAKVDVVPLAKTIIDAFVVDGTMRWTYALRTLARELKGRERTVVAEYATTKATTADEFFVRDLKELALKLGQ